jgi:hypothetical protein
MAGSESLPSGPIITSVSWPLGNKVPAEQPAYYKLRFLQPNRFVELDDLDTAPQNWDNLNNRHVKTSQFKGLLTMAEQLDAQYKTLGIPLPELEGVGFNGIDNEICYYEVTRYGEEQLFVFTLIEK